MLMLHDLRLYEFQNEPGFVGERLQDREASGIAARVSRGEFEVCQIEYTLSVLALRAKPFAVRAVPALGNQPDTFRTSN